MTALSSFSLVIASVARNDALLAPEALVVAAFVLAYFPEYDSSSSRIGKNAWLKHGTRVAWTTLAFTLLFWQLT